MFNTKLHLHGTSSIHLEATIVFDVILYSAQSSSCSYSWSYYVFTYG